MPGARLMILALTLAPTLLVACNDGNDGGLPKEHWIERADELCKEEKETLEALEAPDADPFDLNLTQQQLVEIAAYLEASLRIQDELTADLDDLGLPADDEGDIEDVLDARETGSRAVAHAINAAEAGNPERFVMEYRQAATEYSKASQGARDFGLRECGQP